MRERGRVAEPVVAILIRGETYAVPSEGVRLIVHQAKLSKLRDAHSAVRGALALRGGPVPVVDVGERLGLGKAHLGRETKVAFVTIHERLTGVVLDDVLGVVVLDPPELDAYGGRPSAARFCKIVSVSGNPMPLLDLEQLFSPEELDRAATLPDRSSTCRES